MTEKFDQTAYWINRHERYAGDPRSIGNLGKSYEENARGDQLVARWVSEAAVLLSDYKEVLDIGCGYGRVAPSFCEAGFNYHGVDCSPVAIQKAKQATKKWPNARFEVAELSTWSPNQQYDLVCALFVLVHFVDDAAWHDMLKRMLGWVRPGGALLVAESSFSEQMDRPVEHVKTRSLQTYDAVLAEAGFTWRNGFAYEIAAKLPDDAPFPTCHLAYKVVR